MVAVKCDHYNQTEEAQLPDAPPQDSNYESDLETLSLCDLPLYGGDELNEEDHLSSIFYNHHEDDDPFEFSSSYQDLSNKSSVPVANNIVFCGRLIPYGREPPPHTSADSSCIDIKSKTGSAQKPKKRRRPFVFRWKVRMFRKQRNHGFLYKKVADDHHDRNNNNVEKIRSCPSEKWYKFTVGKVSAQSSGRIKYRWYLLMFGSARFPVAMELQDIKTRQTRNSNNNNHQLMTKFHMSSSSEDSHGHDDGKAVNSGNWGLLRLLKTLSCRSSSVQHGGRNAVLKRSYTGGAPASQR